MTKPEQTATDKPKEKEEPKEGRTEGASDEAAKSAVDLVKQQRQEMKTQKDPDRPPMSTSLKFGRPEIVGEGGEKLVKATPVTGKDGSPPPLEEPGKVKERIPANKTPGHPFEEVVYEDGTKRQLRPGGTIVEIRKDMTITARPDHSLTITQNGKSREVKPTHPEREVKNTKVGPTGNVMYEYKDNTTEQVLDDGTRFIKNKDGTETMKMPDGTYSIQDGQVSRSYDAKGNLTSTMTFNPDDNTIVHTDKNGRVEKTVSNANPPSESTRYRDFEYGPDNELTKINGHLGKWRREVDKDSGQEYWQNQDKPDMKWYGKMSIDKTGNVHYTPHDPQAQAWTFTRDDRDVRAARK